MRAKRPSGQVSAEYIVITAFLLIAAALIFAVSLFFFSENSKTAQAQEAVYKIVNNANLAASLGDGSKIYFDVDIPEGVNSFRANNGAVNMNIASVAGANDVTAYAKVNFTPVTFATTAGRRQMSAHFSDGNVVIS